MKQNANIKEQVTQHKMVRWYNPALLFRMALRSLTAIVFRQMVDNREIQAALNPVTDDELKGAYDFSENSTDDAFWIDYVADLGDGWDSTYAVASLLAIPSLSINKQRLKRGNVLIMGGDQVYPDPSAQAYEERMIAPYTAASKHAYMDHEPNPPSLFALPGNHDWFDGLHAFINVFCPSRGNASDSQTCTVGSWLTEQKRSYFCLKLPQNWWLCGVDVQLDAGINTTQIDYFKSIAQSQMKAGDRLILCCETPEWLLNNISDTQRMDSFAEILDVLTPSGAELRLILAGDIHHYNRYTAMENDVEFITAGGGGAFLHPTHKLPISLGDNLNANNDLNLKACYPNKDESKKHSNKLVLFPFKNWDFALLIGIIYSFMAWIVEAETTSEQNPMSQYFISWLSNNASTLDVLSEFFIIMPRTPTFAITLIVLYVGFIKFNFCKRLSVSIGLGIAHALAHFIPFVLAYLIASYAASPPQNESFIILNNVTSFAVFILTMLLISSLFGGLIFGIYLWVALNCFGLHWTNSFSALRIDSYRNFLRLSINKHGVLTIYPLKVDQVSATNNKAELIEPPIIIQ